MANLVEARSPHYQRFFCNFSAEKCFFVKVKVKLSKWSILLLKVKLVEEVCNTKCQKVPKKVAVTTTFGKCKFDIFGLKYGNTL